MNDVYFVMLTTPNGSAVPMLKDDRMAFFDNAEDAKDAALNTALGQDCGWEVFELGGGIDSN